MPVKKMKKHYDAVVNILNYLLRFFSLKKMLLVLMIMYREHTGNTVNIANTKLHKTHLFCISV